MQKLKSIDIAKQAMDIIKKAFILDFDLHTGDGNINILENLNDGFTVSILNPESTERGLYIQEVEAYMKKNY